MAWKNKNIAGQGFHTNPERINKSGRPLGFKGLTKTMRDILNTDGTMNLTNVVEVDKDGRETGRIFEFAKVSVPKAEMIVIAALRKAAKGDIRAIEMVFDRMDGTVAQTINGEITTVNKGFWDYYVEAAAKN